MLDEVSKDQKDYITLQELHSWYGQNQTSMGALIFKLEKFFRKELD